MNNSSNHPVFTYESLKGRELNREEDRVWRINEKSMKKKNWNHFVFSGSISYYYCILELYMNILICFHLSSVRRIKHRWRQRHKMLLFLWYKTTKLNFATVLSLIAHWWRQNVRRTSVTHSAVRHVPLFLFLPQFWGYLWSITGWTNGKMESSRSNLGSDFTYVFL